MNRYTINTSSSKEQLGNLEEQDIFYLLTYLLNIDINKMYSSIQNKVKELPFENYELTDDNNSDATSRSDSHSITSRYIAYYKKIFDMTISDIADEKLREFLRILFYPDIMTDSAIISRYYYKGEIDTLVTGRLKRTILSIKYLQDYADATMLNDKLLNPNTFDIYARYMCMIKYSPLLPDSMSKYFNNRSMRLNRDWDNYNILSAYLNAIESDNIYSTKADISCAYSSMHWLLSNTTGRFIKCENCNRTFISFHGNDRYCDMPSPHDHSLSCKEYRKRLNAASSKKSSTAYLVKRIQDRKRRLKTTHPDDPKLQNDLKTFNNANKEIKMQVKNGVINESVYLDWLNKAMSSRLTPELPVLE